MRELRQHGSCYRLCADHPDFGPFPAQPGKELGILGVAIAMVRTLYLVAGYRPPNGPRS